MQPTSIEANKLVNREGWYARIRTTMREGEWCIADLAGELNAEKSTISARLNEMRKFSMIEKTNEKPSFTTGIRAIHYQLKQQESLF